MDTKEKAELTKEATEKMADYEKVYAKALRRLNWATEKLRRAKDYGDRVTDGVRVALMKSAAKTIEDAQTQIDEMLVVVNTMESCIKDE